MLTINEKRILRLLLTSIDMDYSINGIAKECKITPNGALKILYKFEKEGVLYPKKIANIKSYKLNFDGQKTKSILELALISELGGPIKYRADDLNSLRETTSVCIFFGSYLDKKNPNDLDVLFVLDKTKYVEYSKKIKAAKELMPIKVHDVVQTKEDIAKNILLQDKVVLNILRTGLVVWGQKKIIQVICSVYKG